MEPWGRHAGAFLDRAEQVGEGLVGTVAVGRYGQSRLNLAGVESARELFTELARDRLGFGQAEELEGDGTRDAVWTGIDRFARSPAKRKILYWTGHGETTENGYVLACADTHEEGVEGLSRAHRAVSVVELVRELSQDPADVLLIVDACRAGRPLPWIRAHLLVDDLVRRAPDPGAGGFAVVFTAAENQPAEEGRWVEWLRQVLDDPSTTAEDRVRPFQASAPYVPFSHLMSAVEILARREGAPEAVQLPYGHELRRLRFSFLHNEYFDGELRPTATRDERADWLGKGLSQPAVRPLTGGGVGRRSAFTGRRRALARIVTWLDTHANGLLAVTGPAGSGKTALLGHLAQLTKPGFHASLEAPPPLDAQPRLRSVHAALHCQGRTMRDLCGDLRRALEFLALRAGVQDGESSPEGCVRWVGRISEKVGALNLVFDGLDEAAAGQPSDIARDLLNPLAALGAVKVLVGTRIQPRQMLPGRVPEETLYEVLDQTVPAVALDQDEDAERDIAQHVARVLAEAPGSPYAAVEPAEVRQAAEEVAERSGRLFLVADLWARDLARGPETRDGEALREYLGSGNDALNVLMERELAQLDQGGRLRAVELLRPLALAQGAWLPESRVWLAMASAAAEGVEAFTEEQLRTVLAYTSGTLLIRVVEQEGAVYRFQHPSFGLHLLESAPFPQAVLHRQVFERLVGLCRG
ncbi:caspase family protein, partial [Streptomyces sp. SBT349]|uniref:caspase family protein n=1 Tax=Streptomyces sp. SBT349 TaxID=1580539 RepID=UPI00066AA599